MTHAPRTNAPRRPLIRLTPLVIFLALLVLGLKIGGLFDPAFAADEQKAAVAEDKPGTPEKPVEDSPDKTPAPAPADKAAAAEEKPGDKSIETEAAAADGAADDEDEDRPGRECSPAELALMSDLAKRRATVDAREKAAAQREALLSAAEQQFNARLAELNATRDQIQALLNVQSEAEEASLKSLVKMYEVMKPADAARIFDTLDMEVLTDVAMRMKEAKLAPIVAQMSAEAARALTMRLAARPRPGAAPVSAAPAAPAPAAASDPAPIEPAAPAAAPVMPPVPNPPPG